MYDQEKLDAVEFLLIFFFFKAVESGNKRKDTKRQDSKQKEQMRKNNLKKQKSTKEEDQPDASLKGIDVRILHEAYQLLMKKYCPEKKKMREDRTENTTPDSNIGMGGF